MLKQLLSVGSFFLPVLLFAQSDSPDFRVVTAQRVAVASPRNPLPFVPKQVRNENGFLNHPKKTATVRPPRMDEPPRVDPLLQTGTALRPLGVQAASAVVGTNVNGLGFTSVNPSDPVITVGPAHVIQMINAATGARVRIFNKDGSPAGATFNFSAITGVQGAGDPIALYDQLANRWVLAEFGYSGGVTSYVNTLIMAVSATEDPFGTWYSYAFADNSFFVDFPKFAVWNDAYYATSNDFNTGATAYLGSSIYAFDRTKMLNGDLTATAIRQRFNSADGRFFSMAPISLEGNAAPPVGVPGGFLYYSANEYTSDPADADSLYFMSMTPNFTTPAATVIGSPQRMLLSAFDDELCTATRGRCIDQQTNTATDLEDLAGRITNKIVYRNFGTYQGIVLNFTVDANGSGLGGIRWMELRRPGATWNVHQEGTWAPDGNERWLGGITYDGLGNIGLMYNVSGTTANPSIRFTGRNACDPLGQMTLPETTIIDGTASNASTRYGDYNVLTIDPATDRDFWMTAQHNNGSTNWNTRIAAFSLNSCSTIPVVRFASNRGLAIEDSLTTPGGTCLRYRDFVVSVLVENAPSQPVTVNLQTGGTATLGIDYTIFPNSLTLSAATPSQSFTIRVFDDRDIESVEEIVLTYTLNNGGGNAVADTYNQEYRMQISDNDRFQGINNNSLVLLSEGFGTAVAAAPQNAGWVINSSGTTNVWTYSGNGGTGITTGAAHITNNTTTNPLAYTITTTANSRLISPIINASSISATDSLLLFLSYKCNGEIFSGTLYDFGRIQYSLDGTNFINLPGVSALQGVTAMTNAQFVLPDLLKGQSFYLGFYWQNDNSVGNNPPFTIDTLAVFARGVPVQTTIVPAVSYLVGQSSNAFMNSADGRVIARINNASAPIGCVSAQLAAAGNGRLAATINGGSSFRSEKVIQLSPTNVFSGTHQTTLYFTTDELAAWGASAASLNILQVSDATPLVGNIVGTLVTPVAVQDLRATLGYVAYTANFTGFSKFMLTSSGTTPLPVRDLQFVVRPARESITAQWTTRAEINTASYTVERSLDGRIFEPIHQQVAAGNSTTLRHYTFTDDRVLANTWYYYRLMQTDQDGSWRYSTVQRARLDSRFGGMVVQPNPAQDQVRVQLLEQHTRVQFRLVDATGKQVWKSERLNAQANGWYTIPVQQLASGMYWLEAITAEGKQQTRLQVLH